jgi:hypothetical protein
MRYLASSCVALCFAVSCSKTERDYYSTGDAEAAGGTTSGSSAGAAGLAGAAGGAGGGTSGSSGAAASSGTAGQLDDCGDDAKACGGKCVPLTDPAYGCGAATCDDSACPNPGPSGTLVCEGSSCKIGSCGAGFKLCDETCVAVTDPTYGCGAATCDDSSCPDLGADETLVCEGGECVIGECGPGTKKCGNKCVPTDRNNGCEDPGSCAACDSKEECVGEPSECACIPVDREIACAGKECGTVSNGCGEEYECGTCTAPPNAVATCQLNTCVNSCAASIMPLTCPDIAPNMPRCGVWSFETNTVEGWTKGDPSDAAITAKTTIGVGTAQKVDGSRSLMVTTTIPGGENPSTFDYEQMITFEAPLCPDLSSLNLTNRVFEVNAYFERISGTPLNSGNTVVTAGSQQRTGGGQGGVGSSPFSVTEGKWLSGTAQVSPAATHLTISVNVVPRLAQPWHGRIYFDLLALH